MSGRHVCMVVKNRLSNDARVKKEMKALSGDGWRVTVIAMPEKGEPEEEIRDGIRIIRPPVYSRGKQQLREKVAQVSPRGDPSLKARMVRSIRKNRFRRFFADLQRDIPWEMKLRRAAIQSGADVYHANDLDTLDICGRAADRNRAKLVYDSHELWLESSRFLIATNPLNGMRLKRIERKYASRADAVIAVTPLRGREMGRMYPGMKRLSIIENAPEKLHELPGKGTLRRMADIGENEVIALYQGVLCPERGLEELIEAASMAGSTGVKFVVIGMDAWNGTLQEMAARAGLSDRIAFLPPVPSEKLPEITVDADMGFILFRNTCLNHFYSLPNKLYEYMMAGVPVIASGFPEMQRVINETGCGITVDPESPSEIFSAVKSLAENPEERKLMADAGRKSAMEKYNWEPQREKLIRLYREIME